MARSAARITLLEVVLGLVVLLIVGRAAQLQVLQGARWSQEADRERRANVRLPARRGAILDRNGIPLVVTQEFYHVGVAPEEVDERRVLTRKLARQLEIPQAEVERGLASGKRYLYYYGPFTAVQVQPLRGLSGVHLESEFRRFYPSGDLARPIIGGYSADSLKGMSGLERTLDSLLTGVPGEAVYLKDRAGRRYESPSRIAREPIAGNDVVLTLDSDLQAIAEQGLDEAVEGFHAKGGDVVFLDPRTGEILALASRQETAPDATAVRPSTLTDPFEPGSTAKLFTAAALLADRLVDSTDAVYAENGKWVMPVNSRRTRTITDAHASKGNLTLAQAIQVSSNIAMAKFSLRLTREQHYDALRNFGFGSPTGVEFPVETRGRLARPNEWEDHYSGPSLAMGYELEVTPLQLAAAYGAIANDGILLTPALVREIIAPDGTVLYRHQPEPIRRAVPPEVAARLRRYLRGAVSEGGTGERAQLVNYTLLGKTGTARRFEGGRYVQNSYNASFAALFPADDPQLAVIVKIEDPQGEYYGGQTAGPVTRRMLAQALASRRVAIDRSRLAGGPPAGSGGGTAGEGSEDEPATRVTLPWPLTGSEPEPKDGRPVPDVVGAPVRKAVLALHRRGFMVDLHGLGRVRRSQPTPGDSLPAGKTVTLWAE